MQEIKVVKCAFAKVLETHAEAFRLKVGGKWELLPISEWMSDKIKIALRRNEASCWEQNTAGGRGCRWEDL